MRQQKKNNNTTPAVTQLRDPLSTSPSEPESPPLLEGFRAVELPLKKRDDLYVDAIHWIYLKKLRHKQSEDLAGSETSFLFIANLPPSVTEQQLRSVLEPFGTVTTIVYGRLPETENYSKHASVFFADEHSIELILRSPLDFSSCLLDEDMEEDIITSKLKEYKKWRSNPIMLSQRVDEVLFRYRQKCEEEEKELEYRQTVPDEDGFILVGPSKRKRNNRAFPFLRKRAPLEVSESSLKPKEGFYKILSRKQQRKLEREQREQT
ncbi:hypothetical protein GAYE_SCF23G4299 [Galdieria yellowstonensis]|uniref:RRM domain-containing protein n=1 Tax=Galdieria yellowstonensis TaxID=3028027 RepID=A0AAV9IG91_9RHOD|nr:hypothetical protein GAYE_SCF23G4299 [Galdieria yellowstonensis]